MVSARGCLENCSNAAAYCNARSSDFTTESTSLTTGWPKVRVPVLSKTTAFTFASFSMYNPPFTRTPLLAATVTAAKMVAGTEITKALGQETTSKIRDLYIHVLKDPPVNSGTAKAEKAARPMTIGT